jgi:hypothetical protein
MTANVDRTYRANPGKFSGDLTTKITAEAASQLRTWEAQGQLPPLDPHQEPLPPPQGRPHHPPLTSPASRHQLR